MSNEKPLGMRAYGSIPHLKGSRRGPADSGINDGQQRICCERRRDKFDCIIVQEKLDGSNVSIAKIDGVIVPLIRAGYAAATSPYEQHHLFSDWVLERKASFDHLLRDGERLCGEWLAQAHGTRYDLKGRSPFVAFDLMRGQTRATLGEFTETVVWCVDSGLFDVPPLLWIGEPIGVETALGIAGEFGRYGAIDPIEGVVYRVERNGTVDFLAKYVRPEKVDGKYLPIVSGESEVWNWRVEDVE